MKLKFDPGLEYQIEAIQAVTDLFEGLPPKEGAFEISLSSYESQVSFVYLGVVNRFMLDHDRLLDNLHAVQERNIISKSRSLVEEEDFYHFPNFSVA